MRIAAVIVALFCSGCATSSQRAAGMDNNDARREAAWFGAKWTIERMIFGPGTAGD